MASVVNPAIRRRLNLSGISRSAYVSAMSGRKIMDGGTAFEDDDLDEDEALASSGPDYAPPEVMLDIADLPRRLATGMQVIRSFWETLPGSPGVYRMISTTGEVLYVGKARNLKARVSSYARGDAPNNRIARMIAETGGMEFVTTTTEAEALLLETNLIKQLKPRYNVLMRDVKSFPFILITGEHEAPQITKHRGARNRKGRYFGPFASAGAVNRNAQHAAARVPAALLHGLGLRKPLAALSALPDQALCRALHRRDLPRGLCSACARGQRLPGRQEPGDPAGSRQGDAGSLRFNGIRDRRALSRPSRGDFRCLCPSRA